MTELMDSSAAVSAAAERYRSAGYQIDFGPSGLEQLPEVVRSFRPDFIAKQGDEHIAVEVKARSQLQHEQLRRYAELFRSLPGWRFDLVVIPDESTPLPEPRLLSRASLRKRLRAADALASELQDIGGAIVLLWTVIEACLRAEIGNDDRSRVRSSSRLVKEALSLGLITQKEWETLDRFGEMRNQIAHGEAPRHVTRSTYHVARSIASRLIDRIAK